ncbi:MAG: hypothetical protein QXR48_00885 [Candidatus Woesearchaeota archaeon]
MTEEGKGIALAILAIVALIAVVGLILLFKGATAKVSYSYEKPFNMIVQPAERLCANMACNNGVGAIVLGEETRQDGEYWICGCPKQFIDKKITDWSNRWKGDEARDGLDFGNYEFIWRVRKFREY